ncbi:MAG: caspase family protein [Candidatus Thermoplasmatota archaeon]|nr:caspase family protein [Candidatus Thermoplasmatota archaeon]MBU1940890.1 caspase family protein [Candidatus Thermoplasmatota archaeon]
MDLRIIAVLCSVLTTVAILSGCLGEDTPQETGLPLVVIEYPLNDQKVSNLVMISGYTIHSKTDKEILGVEVLINGSNWEQADGQNKWSYDWPTYTLNDGIYSIQVRAWDGIHYSAIETITVNVDNPESIQSDSPKFALFIAAANFPTSNESKLGNGGFYFAEEMASYLIQQAGYATDNVVLLFDDGWIRNDNGFGERIMTLQQRSHTYDITYGGATAINVADAINRLIETVNNYENSEVFLWLFNHGCGDQNNELTGGKIFEPSQIFLWDAILSDKQLGTMLKPLEASKTTIIIDACYTGGFAEKTIYNIPTSILFRSNIPQPGRVVITGASKFRKGYASTTYGPLFSLLWYEGLTTGNADGFHAGLFNIGRPTQFSMFKDGVVSVEEAFHYVRYILRTDPDLKEYRIMQPQMNDMYPHRGLLRNNPGLVLTEH